MKKEKTYREVHSINSSKLDEMFKSVENSTEETFGWIKKTAKEVNATRVRITNKSEGTVVTIPLTVAGVGAFFAPLLTLAGLGIAIATGGSIVFEKEDKRQSRRKKN